MESITRVQAHSSSLSREHQLYHQPYTEANHHLNQGLVCLQYLQLYTLLTIIIMCEGIFLIISQVGCRTESVHVFVAVSLACTVNNSTLHELAFVQFWHIAFYLQLIRLNVSAPVRVIPPPGLQEKREVVTVALSEHVCYFFMTLNLMTGRPSLYII